MPVLGDWVIASLVDEDGRMSDVASWHRDPDLRPAVAPGEVVELLGIAAHVVELAVAALVLGVRVAVGAQTRERLLALEHLEQHRVALGSGPIGAGPQ